MEKEFNNDKIKSWIIIIFFIDTVYLCNHKTLLIESPDILSVTVNSLAL